MAEDWKVAYSDLKSIKNEVIISDPYSNSIPVRKSPLSMILLVACKESHISKAKKCKPES